jgi:GT2 family glycosyltransferase
VEIDGRAQTLENRFAAVEEDLASHRERLRDVRHAYAVVDRSKFARLRTWWLVLLDLLGLRGEVEFLAASDESLLQAPIAPVAPSSAERLVRPRTTYERWLERNDQRESDHHLQRRLQRFFPYRPIVSLIVPTYDTHEMHLVAMLDSVIAQSYPNWELCIADDCSRAPHVREILDSYAARDPRIKIVYRTENGHISAASNSALEIATGEFIGLLDHDDLLAPDALFQNVLALNENAELDMLYSDEDKLAADGVCYEPFFKPDWAPETFLSRMYTCHFGVYRRSLIEAVGGFRVGYEGSQDYDLVLRVTERTDRIHHIARILYHWRVHPLSAAMSTDAKPYAYLAAQRALAESLARRGEPGRIEHVEGCPGLYIPHFDITRPGRVSIVIPTRDRADDLERCLRSVFKSSWIDYEVVLVDNGTVEPDALKVMESWSRWDSTRVRVVRRDEPFNFSRLVNAGVEATTGSYIILLNNDTEIVTKSWIELMMEQAQRPSIGAVGCKLTFPDGTVQHAGIVLGLGGAAGHGHYKFNSFDHGYFGAIKTVNNYSAVTAACMMVRREAFDLAGGFDPELSIAYNDVDFCLKLRAKGLRNVYLPHVEVRHFESASRGTDIDPARADRNLFEQELLIDRWNVRTTPDPYYNVNLALTDPDFRIAVVPAQRLVFRDERLLEAYSENQRSEVAAAS